MASVHARLDVARRMGVDASFPFGELASLISMLSPTRVEIAFHRREGEKSAVDLGIDFEETSAASAMLVKEALIRCEAELDFDCTFPQGETVASSLADNICLEVRPDVACLPSRSEIAVSLPLVDAGRDVFRQAHLTHSQVSYHIELTRWAGDPQLARAVVPAVAQLRHGRRSTEALQTALEDALELLRAPGWSARERVCIPEAARLRDQGWIENIVRKHVRKIAGFLPDDLLSLNWGPAGEGFAARTLQQIVAGLRFDEYLEHVLNRLAPSGGGSRGLLASLHSAQRSARDPVLGNYAFVSYAHRDSAFVNALVEALGKAGANCWIDSRIEAGARWDETLEDRIRQCGVVVACVSDEYQQSKYCRRELKFADLIDKPIVPVAPAPWTWQAGLQMMFQELQVASFDGGRGFPELHRRLRNLAPGVFN